MKTTDQTTTFGTGNGGRPCPVCRGTGIIPGRPTSAATTVPKPPDKACATCRGTGKSGGYMTK